jgi:hypothetical protein
MKNALLVLSFVLSCCVAACRTTTTSAPARSSDLRAAHMVPVGAWELWDADEKLGSVVRFEEREPSSRGFYSVLDLGLQDLGLIDLQGRAWRYRAHERESEWVGSGTVLRGARAILGGGAASRLVEVELEKLVPGAGRTPQPVPGDPR